MENLSFGFTAAPVIAALSYFIVEAIKGVLETFDKVDWAKIPKIPPILAGFIGGLLGLAAYYLINDYPANDVMTAITIGVISGGGATWGHQIKTR